MKTSRMTRVGRILTAAGILGLALVLSVTHPLTRSVLDSNGLFVLVNLVSAATVATLLTTWALAVYHWGTRYDGARRSLWGVVTILGVFIGSWLYWWFGARTPAS